MTKSSQYKHLEERIIRSIKAVYDPDISVNIYDLGLIYKIDINEDNSVKVTMTLTSPSCPVAESLPVEVKENVQSVQGVTNAEVVVVFEPPWEKEMMSEEALLELGWL